MSQAAAVRRTIRDAAVRRAIRDAYDAFGETIGDEYLAGVEFIEESRGGPGVRLRRKADA